MRAKEHLAIVRARDGALSLTTMRFHDEVRSATNVPSATGKTAKPSKAELDTAVSLIEALAEDWDPTSYQDRYRKRAAEDRARQAQGQDDRDPRRREVRAGPAAGSHGGAQGGPRRGGQMRRCPREVG